jgi:hypothetical protein
VDHYGNHNPKYFQLNILPGGIAAQPESKHWIDVEGVVMRPMDGLLVAKTGICRGKTGLPGDPKSSLKDAIFVHSDAIAEGLRRKTIFQPHKDALTRAYKELEESRLLVRCSISSQLLSSQENAVSLHASRCKYRCQNTCCWRYA